MTKGFTLIELLIVIIVALILVGLTIPIGLNFYNNQVLDETADSILSILRRAHGQAVFQKNDSAFGVKFLEDYYVLFQGDSYALRVQSQDEIFNLPLGFNLSGFDEFVFSKHQGTTTAGIIIINTRNNTQIINVNYYGKIEREQIY